MECDRLGGSRQGSKGLLNGNFKHRLFGYLFRCAINSKDRLLDSFSREERGQEREVINYKRYQSCFHQQKVTQDS